MKKYNHLPLLALLLLFTASSCKKLLEPKIYTSVNASNFPTTEADAKSALIPFYAQFNTDYGSYNRSAGVYDFSFNSSYLGYSWATSIQTDEAFDEYYGAYSTFNLGPATFSLKSGQSFYDRVSYVAKLTDLIGRFQNSSILNKTIYIAEAKGLRAWFMFILLDLYGPSNPRLDPATVNSLVITPRMSEADYVTALTADLNDAIAALPTNYNGSSTDWGRISKGVASMILLKTYMLEAGRTMDVTYWTKAKTVSQSLTGMGYSLDPSYKDVFSTSRNSEVIYAVPGNSASNNATAGTNINWFSCIIPFDAKTILGQDVTQNQNYKLDMMPWAFYDKFSASDKRLQTIANSYINTSGNTVDRSTGLDGAIPMKYPFVANGSGFDYVMFQYSDVLLSLAEINNQINGPTSETLGYLKQVTDRANTVIPASATLSKDALSSFILDERGRELYWLPGIRRQDLIRNGTFISSADARGLPAKVYQVLWPIPSDVIIQSNNILKQNPGY
jgi:hypothetical protein